MYKIFIVVDNNSWILPYAERLNTILVNKGHKSKLVTDYNSIDASDISFFLGCIRIAPAYVLDNSKRNLIVHESDLPKGKGFSPMSWQILEGKNIIPICLLEASKTVDSGSIIFRDEIRLEGHELHDEWRSLQGEKTIDLCTRFVSSNPLPEGQDQKGEETLYRRRSPKDSELDISRSIEEQFNLLRIVDNERYPAYFEICGIKYKIKIEKCN